MDDVRRVALELLDCERVTLFMHLDRNTLRGKLLGSPHTSASE
jgi:hypothetical protein